MTFLEKIELWLARRSLKVDRSSFYYDLSLSLDDRVPLFETFKKLESRARRRKSHLAAAYLHMLKSVQKGSLATAMRGIASPMELIVLDAAQAGGDESMANGLRLLSDSTAKTDVMLSAVKKAITYPVLLLIVFGAMLAGFSKFAVPVLVQLMDPAQWPFTGRLLYSLSEFIINYGPISLFFIILILFLFSWSLPNWSGRYRIIFDKYLPYSIYRDYQSAILLLALASLMKSKVSLSSSIERAIKYGSPWLRWHLRQIQSKLSKGEASSFGLAFKTGMLSTALEDRIVDASERSDPIAAFVRIGSVSADRTASDLEKSAKVLSNILLAICGLLLGIMMVGFFSTSFELESSLRSSTQSMGR